MAKQPSLKIEQGFALHQAGNFPGAQRIYEKLLLQSPGDAYALHYLGLSLHNQGRHADAIIPMRKALETLPDVIQFHVNLGPVLRALGKPMEAIVCYEKAIQVNPAVPAVYHNLGNLYLEISRLSDAEKMFQKAIELSPDYAEAIAGLGKVFLQQSRVPEAKEELDRAIALQTGYAEAWGELAIAKGRSNDMDGAEIAATKAVSLNPADPTVWNSLGIIFMRQMRPMDSLGAFEKAITLRPKYADALCNMGHGLMRVGLNTDAKTRFNQAIEFNPRLPQAHSGLASLHSKEGRFYDAIASADHALSLNKSLLDAYFAKAGAYAESGQIRKAFDVYDQAGEISPDEVIEQNGILLVMHYADFVPKKKLFDAHLNWAKFELAKKKRSNDFSSRDRSPDRKLKVAFISPDFRTHSVSFFFESILKHYDRSRFEVILLSQADHEDPTSERFKSLADQWEPVWKLADDDIVEMVGRHEVDILIDLAGHTSNTRLRVLSHRAAPVQATFLGYPDTTGLPTVDYRITDAFADPVGESESQYVEELARLPGCAWCFTPGAHASATSWQPHPEGVIRFASFNNFAKCSETTFELWCSILLQVPDSTLLIKSKCFADERLQNDIRDRFESQHVNKQRITFLALEPTIESHLSRYNDVDIALDTYPYHGTTTTCEALSMGVPVIVLAGDSHASRVGVSLLSATGVTDLIANSPDQYVEIACNLASNATKLTELRSTLRERFLQSPLAEGRSYTNNFENLLRSLWIRYTENPKP